MAAIERAAPPAILGYTSRRKIGETRVLVAYEVEHRAYREVIVAGSHWLRPHVEVTICTPDKLPEEANRKEESDVFAANG